MRGWPGSTQVEFSCSASLLWGRSLGDSRSNVRIAGMSTNLKEITRFLDDHLHVSEIPDDSNAVNGLQLEASAEITRVACAVDAGEPSIEEACRLGANLLVVHHGLLWGGNRPYTGAHARKLKRCFQAGLSVYSVHLPLDVHPQHGNNILVMRALGVSPEGTFGKYQGIEVGLFGRCDIEIGQLVQTVRQQIGDCRLAGRGPERISRLGVISGGGGSLVGSAAGKGLDVLVTGEGPHYAALEAEERGLWVLLAGHYRTEKLGVQALSGLLSERFGLPWSFVDHDTGL
jgi:dinuclear metal center YbgI/SA1388 family protein